MFGKLLKHEFRSQRGVLGWLTVAVLGAGGLGAVAVQLLIHIFRDQMHAAETIISESRETFLIIAAVALVFLLVILLVGITLYANAVYLILCYRFYKHHFTDEGYLTFTLPATTHQILLSSICNMLIWTVISVIAVLLSLTIMGIPLLVLVQQQSAEILPAIGTGFAELYGENFGWLMTVVMVCAALGQMILPLLAITIGAQIAKKYKLLAGIGIYIGLNTVVSFIAGIVSVIVSITSVFTMEAEGIMAVTYSVPSVLYLIIAVGGYFLMHHMVKNKLNLT